MLPSLRTARLPLVRVLRSKPSPPKRNISLAPTAALRADLVQDLYLRELRNYKPPQSQATDAAAHVQKFAIPKPPPAPEEIEIAGDLKAYETQMVDVEGYEEAMDEDPDYMREFFEKPVRDIDEEEARYLAERQLIIDGKEDSH